MPPRSSSLARYSAKPLTLALLMLAAAFGGANPARADALLPGAACTTGTNANSNYGIMTCVNGVLVANPVAIGTTAVTCNSTYTGFARYNATSQKMEYCNGSAWSPFSSSGGYTGTCSGSTGTDTSLASGLVAYYNFDQGSGTSVYDITATINITTDTNNNGTWEGTLGSQWTTGIINGGGSFDGTDNYIAVSPASFLTNNTFTYSAWVYITGTSGIRTIVGGAQAAFPQFRISDSSNQLQLIKEGIANVAVSAGTVPTNAWTHVALTYGSGGAYAFYINGVNAGSGTSPYTFTNSGFSIGSNANSAEFFSGKMDELGIWNVALTSAQIASLYNSGSGNAFDAYYCPSTSSGGFAN